LGCCASLHLCWQKSRIREFASQVRVFGRRSSMMRGPSLRSPRRQWGAWARLCDDVEHNRRWLVGEKRDICERSVENGGQGMKRRGQVRYREKVVAARWLGDDSGVFEAQVFVIILNTIGNAFSLYLTLQLIYGSAAVEQRGATLMGACHKLSGGPRLCGLGVEAVLAPGWRLKTLFSVGVADVSSRDPRIQTIQSRSLFGKRPGSRDGLAYPLGKRWVLEMAVEGYQIG